MKFVNRLVDSAILPGLCSRVEIGKTSERLDDDDSDNEDGDCSFSDSKLLSTLDIIAR